MISQYITGYFNPYRTHQHNGGLPPNKAEENYWLTSKIVVKILSHYRGLIIKVVRGRKAEQIRVRDGEVFDPARSGR